MNLVTPDIGLLFWTAITFFLLLFILKRFAWSKILTAVKEREASIEESLKTAEKAREEIKNLQADNERIIKEAKLERDVLLKEAREMKNNILKEAKEKAATEGDKIIAAAKNEIENQKMAALTDLKNQVAELSIEIAQKILKEELKDNEKQKELVKGLLKEVELN